MKSVYSHLGMLLLTASLLWDLAYQGNGPSIFTSTTSAQDFLKQLEEKVREKLQDAKKGEGTPGSSSPSAQPPSDMPVEESLPAPSARGSIPNPFLLPENRDASSRDNATGELPAPKSRKSSPNPIPDPNQNIDPNLGQRAPYLGLIAEKIAGGRTGLRVVEVAEGSPAWKAGFRVNDRILAVDGFVVSDLDGLGARLQAKPSGTPVKFLVSRDGRNRDVTAVLLDPQIADQTQPSAVASDHPTASGQPVLGLSVENLTENFRRRFGIVAFRGAAVTEVDPNSPASQAGIRPGDCIVEADGEIMQSAIDLQNWMNGKQPGQPATLGIYRGRALNQVQILLGGTPLTLPGTDGEIPSVDPNYTASLEAELQRVRQELESTKRRLLDLEQRLQRFENR